MEEILRELKGKNIDVNCGSGAAFSGENVEISSELLVLADDDGKRFYIDITKIVAVSEVGDSGGKPGFIA